MFQKVLTFFAEHRKAFVGAAGIVAVLLAQEFPANPYAQAALAVATIFGIARVPNQPKPAA